MSIADLPLELIGEIAGESRLIYHLLVRSYPRFARSLTLGDRLDFAEKFGYDCRVTRNIFGPVCVWYLNGEYHRADGPALEHAGKRKAWYANGRLHRLDGPAIEFASGFRIWYINGEFCGLPCVYSERAAAYASAKNI